MKKLKDLITFIKNMLSGQKRLEEGKFIIDTPPTIHNISDLQITKCQTHMEKAKKDNELAGGLVSGITEKEAETILKWAVGNTRKVLNKRVSEDIFMDDGEDVYSSSLVGYCGLSQGVVETLLEGVSVETSTNEISSSITEMSGKHYYSVAIFPIQTENGIVSKPYLVDATVRQFFHRGGQSPGYFLSLSKEGREFSDNLLRDGFIELTPQNAKMYGDAFVLAARGEESSQKTKVDTSGEEYIISMLSDKEQRLPDSCFSGDIADIVTLRTNITHEQVNTEPQQNQKVNDLSDDRTTRK